MTKTTTLMYVATDGSYGDATDLLLVNAADFTAEDYEALDKADDGNRQEEAIEIATYRKNEQIVWAWMDADEAYQIIGTLDAAVATAMSLGQVGLAEEIGDIRDVLRRSGITAD